MIPNDPTTRGGASVFNVAQMITRIDSRRLERHSSCQASRPEARWPVAAEAAPAARIAFDTRRSLAERTSQQVQAPSPRRMELARVLQSWPEFRTSVGSITPLEPITFRAYSGMMELLTAKPSRDMNVVPV
jgi:hypothetical protein